MVNLRDIDKDNYEAICELDVAKEQQELVACNMWSLVEAAYNGNHTTRAIYKGSTPVGMFMWVKETNHKVSIWRFMVDQNYQNEGIGRLAMSLALDEIKSANCTINEIEICYNPLNPVAKEFYGSFGFIETGMDEDNEDMLAVIKLN